MVHAVLTIFFVLLVGNWLKSELNCKTVSLGKYKTWVIIAVILQLAAALFAELEGGRFGNLILHSVGGGVAATLLFFYLMKTFGFKTNWRFELAALMGFVSTLGVINEIGEYVAESASLGIFSLDSHDVWRDLVANTSGMLLAWLAVKSYQIKYREQR